MTTASVPKTTTYRYNLGDFKEQLRGMWYAAGDWARRTRAHFEESRIERWNSERLAMLESRGGAPYK